MQPFLEPAEEMRGETHYEGGTHIASWALGREIPRRRRGWAPRRGSPCASLFAAALAVSEEFDGHYPRHSKSTPVPIWFQASRLPRFQMRDTGFYFTIFRLKYTEEEIFLKTLIQFIWSLVM